VKTKIIFGVISSIVLGVSIVFFLKYKEKEKYESKGNELINRIELYRRQHSRLPNSILDLGIEEQMGEGPYYEKKDSLNYILFFNIGFDNAKIYSSSEKRWKDEP
jgi:hypothetical protein